MGRSGGTAPFTLTLDDGGADLSINAFGVISGTPAGAGTYTLIVGATDAIGAQAAPLVLTLRVLHGYSPLMKIEGHRICLDTVRGFTDGTPPGAVEYVVRSPGQNFVSEKKK